MLAVARTPAAPPPRERPQDGPGRGAARRHLPRGAPRPTRLGDLRSKTTPAPRKTQSLRPFPAVVDHAVSEAHGPSLPTVAMTGAWFDPDDLRVWSGMVTNVVAELSAMGVFAGYRDAGPARWAARAALAVLRSRDPRSGAAPLHPAMRAAAFLSGPAVRRRPPRHAQAWVVPAGTLGHPASGPEIAWCEMAPSQLLALGPARAAAFGLPGVTAGQLRALARAHLALHRRARSSCTVSQWAADALVDAHGIDRRRVHVVGCGRNIVPRGPVVHDWSTPRFLFVGNDWQRKNGPAVMSAFRTLRHRHPGARLDVAGGHPPLDAAGVRGHGQLRLDRPEDRRRLAALFTGATCLVMPSTVEPFGIVYAEAAGFGVASIAGNIGGTTTAVGAGGLLVDPTDHRALVDAMETMADPATAQRLGRLAAQRAPALTWRKVAERILRAAGIAPPDVGALAAFLDDRQLEATC